MKNNNKGFTLVEVLIAMAVLTIVAIPVLNTFSRASNINAKFKMRQRQDTIANNISETIKNCNPEELISDSISSADAIKLNGYSDYTVRRCYSTDEGGYVFGATNASTTEFKYAVCNVKSGAKSYDALVTLTKDTDISSTVGTEVKTLADTKSVIDISAKNIALVDSSGIFDNDDFIDTATTKIQGWYTADGITYSEDEIKSKLKVELEIEVVEENNTYMVYYYVNYSVEDYDDVVQLPEVNLPVYSSATYPDYIYIMFNPSNNKLSTITIDALPRDVVTKVMVFTKSTGTAKRFKLDFADGSDITFMKNYVKIYSNVTNSTVFSNIYSDYIRRGISVNESEATTAGFYKVKVEIYDYEQEDSNKFKGDVLTSMESSFFE